MSRYEIPMLPKGIERDETEHGKIYYTRKQMIEFAQAAINSHKEHKEVIGDTSGPAVSDIIQMMRMAGKMK